MKAIHRPGVKSANCDGLTRQPLLGVEEYGPQDTFEELPTQDSKPKVRAITRNSARNLGTGLEVDKPKHPVSPPVEDEVKTHELKEREAEEPSILDVTAIEA